MGRQAHLENPLTSSAWTEADSLREFSDPQWKRARLDQCTTGLSGLQGGLHKKPTLIRTTTAAMQRALDRQCTGDHDHELVQGSATARSAMYSPYLARLIALVVLKATGLSSGKEGGESFFRHHKPRGSEVWSTQGLMQRTLTVSPRRVSRPGLSVGTNLCSHWGCLSTIGKALLLNRWEKGYKQR